MSRFWVLLLAAFFLFSAAGFYADLLEKGTQPYAIVFMIATYSGLMGCLWIVGITRLPAIAIAALAVLQFFNDPIVTAIDHWMRRHFTLRPVPSDTGIHFAATCMFWGGICSYVFFNRYIIREGQRSIRFQNELELAHDIQKTLVPAVALRNGSFEIYGISHPSEEVGGDLVDAVLLSNGDIVAYLADISGHGLPASILMGRVKTAVRTDLSDAADRNPAATLPLLLNRLNTVLPQVKEPNLYATFTAFRLNADGTLFCAMAASPPILQWHAATRTVSTLQTPQLPIGLLPVTGFEAISLSTAPGDLLFVATDGILETANKQQEEFGTDRLQALIAANPNAPLPALAADTITAAHAFGLQFDDQTLLLIRRL